MKSIPIIFQKSGNLNPLHLVPYIIKNPVINIRIDKMKMTNDISGVGTVVLVLVAVAILVGAGVSTYIILNNSDNKNDDGSDNGSKGVSDDAYAQFREIIQGNLEIGSVLEYKPGNRESTGSASALLFGETGTHYFYVITTHDAKHSTYLSQMVYIHKTTGDLVEPFVLQSQTGSTKIFSNDSDDDWFKTVKVEINNGGCEIVEIEFYIGGVGTKQTCIIDYPSCKLVPNDGIPYTPSSYVGTVILAETKTTLWKGELRGDITTKIRATVIGDGIDDTSLLLTEIVDVQTNGPVREIADDIPTLGKIYTLNLDRAPLNKFSDRILEDAYNKIGEEVITTYKGDVLVNVYEDDYVHTSDVKVYLGVDDGLCYMRKSYSDEKPYSSGRDSTTVLTSVYNTR